MESRISELGKQQIDISQQKKLEAEIIEASAKHKAYNVNHVFRILKDDFTISEDGQFYKELKDENGQTILKKTVEETVKDFLSENDHLVTSPVKSGTGHQFSMSFKSNRKPQISKDELKRANEMGLSPEDFKQISQLKERKLAKIKQGAQKYV